MEPVGFHDLFYVFQRIPHTEGQQILVGHEKAHRYTLVYESCCRKSIVRCTYDYTSTFYRQLLYSLRRRRSLTHHQAPGPQLDGRKMCLETVAHDDKIRLLDELLHQIRTGRRYGNLALVKKFIFSIADYTPVQRLCDAGEAGLCIGKHVAVALVHVGLGDIRYGNDPLQYAVRQYRQRPGSLLIHQIPCAFYGVAALHAAYKVQLHIAYLGLHRPYVLRSLHAEMLQYELRLFIQLPGSVGSVFPAWTSGLLLKLRVCHCRADRIRIRIPVSRYVNSFLYFFLFHCSFPVIYFLIYCSDVRSRPGTLLCRDELHMLTAPGHITCILSGVPCSLPHGQQAHHALTVLRPVVKIYFRLPSQPCQCNMYAICHTLERS